MNYQHMLQIAGSLLACLVLAGCGPSEEDMATTVAIAVNSTIAAIPTMTPYPTLTPFPTLTPTPTPPPTNTPLPYNVEGQLFWNDEPLQGTEVKLAPTEGQPFVTLTNEQGRYIFLVPTGEYRLSYRFPVETRWISSQSTPYFSPYRYIEEPIVVEEGEIVSLSDVHTIRLGDLVITFPTTHEMLSARPTFEWEAYPPADYYLVWIYLHYLESGVPYSYPAGNSGTTRATTFTFDWPLPVYDNYYLWVIAYNANGHELADGQSSSFGVQE